MSECFSYYLQRAFILLLLTDTEENETKSKTDESDAEHGGSGTGNESSLTSNLSDLNGHSTGSELAGSRAAGLGAGTGLRVTEKRSWISKGVDMVCVHVEYRRGRGIGRAVYIVERGISLEMRVRILLHRDEEKRALTQTR